MNPLLLIKRFPTLTFTSITMELVEEDRYLFKVRGFSNRHLEKFQWHNIYTGEFIRGMRDEFYFHEGVQEHELGDLAREFRKMGIID